MTISRRRLITFITIVATTILVSSAPVMGRGRIETGSGQTRTFYKGERVDGAVITLNGGRTGYRCHFNHAPRGGKVKSGVINPYNAEIKTPLCKNTLMSPGPRKEAGEDGRRFQKGDHVLGFAIEINVDPRGRTYFKCALVKAEADGFVYGGVVNPSRFEIRDENRKCRDTQDWNPGFRVESGGGNTIHFYAGERILGAYIVYDDGTKRYDCYDRVADMNGTLTSGVVNYWPGEKTPQNAC